MQAVILNEKAETGMFILPAEYGTFLLRNFDGVGKRSVEGPTP